MSYRLLGLGVAAIAMTGILAGPAAAQQHLVLYSANDDTVNTMVSTGFTAATGIKVDVISTGSGVLLRRLASERENPQADVVWGTSASLLKQNSSYFQPYAAKEKDAVPAAYRDPDDLWLGTNLQILTISQNTTSIPAAAGPHSWADLLDPKWKDKIAFTDPANSGSAYVTATFLLALWGNDDGAWSKLGQLLGNTKVLNRSTLVFDGNGNGEYPLGISLEYAGNLWAHNGAPVQVTYPADGTAVVPEAIAIVKGAPDLDAAKAFVDFINSKPMQTQMLQTTFRRPARQDIDFSAVHMPPLSEIKLVAYDDLKWDAARRQTLERLKTLIQNTR
ncbi:MAG TPA: extracellular solute-binding protein [Aliidongia sp.]|uniref:extracellular solute-binding protein n=1 Tax=Aliidongia sp. TaxID=1914230 RepID=UPI002DDD6BAF|nr:extracellular solute-binding protein [Aliidongia sp.]HEV2674782.1 extracellular solute-binding protein [Aliidongia sp.]